MTSAPPMQRETIALPFEAVLTVARVRRRRCHLRRWRAAGDKGRQALDIAVVIFGCRVLRMTTAKTRLFAKLFTWLEELHVTRQIRLRVPRTKHRLLAHALRAGGLLVTVVDHVVAGLVPTVDS